MNKKKWKKKTYGKKFTEWTTDEGFDESVKKIMITTKDRG